MAELSQLDKEHLQKIMKDPALWSQAFLRTFNPETKKTGPWVPRWYQVEMLRDQSRTSAQLVWLMMLLLSLQLQELLSRRHNKIASHNP